MEEKPRGADGTRSPADPARTPGADGRPADEHHHRRVADEALARTARARLRTQGIVAVDPDCRIAAMLAPDELLVAVRRSIFVDRRRSPGPEAGLAGDLYVTTHRLVHLGRRAISCSLDEIRDVVLAPDRLLLVLDGGQGLAVVVDDPQHLRVEIAAARAAARVRSAAAVATDGDERA